MLKFVKKTLLIACLPAIFSFFLPFGSPDELIVKLEEYLAYYTPEKVYLHHDKPYYSAGDTLWFSTYLVHGISHMATAPSKLVYVELVGSSGSVLIKRDIFMTEGAGNGEFVLADSLVSGTYLLRAYTGFMRNFDQDYFFKKEIQIENAQLPSFDPGHVVEKGPVEPIENYADLVRFQFFPEGGDMVNGLWSTVAFKATGPDGNSVEIEGEVNDSKGGKIADIKSGRFGTGKFLMQPVEGESYTATLKFGTQKMQVPLPKARSKGYVMTLTNVSPKFITFKVESAGGESLEGGVVVGHVRGVVFLTLAATPGQPLQGLIPKENLPEGIAHFTFFDGLGRPQAERLVFVDQSAKRPVAKATGLQAEYGKRSKVSVGIEVADQVKATPSRLSVTVVDKSKVQFDPLSDNIVSYLLMSSDIKGKVENPGYYFDETNKDRAEALDNLMMTQGWRRFTWKDLMENKKPEINHLVEPGFSIAGRVTDFFFPSKGVKSAVTITATEADGDLWTAETETDENGYFLFAGLDIDDTARLVVQTPSEKKAGKKSGSKEALEKGNVNLPTKITITPPIAPIENYVFRSRDALKNQKAIAAYLEEARKVKEIEEAFAKQDVIILDELEVQSQKMIDAERFKKPGMTYDRPTRRVDVDSLSKTSQFLSIFETFVGRTPGVRVVGSFPNYNAIIRGSANLEGGTIYPLYLLNGSIVDVSMINSIPVNRVDFVDVLTSTGATMYGTQGAGGVIAVYLKDGDEVDSDYVPKGSLGMTHPGFYQAKEFYVPDYSVKKESHARTDVRPTLYWKAGLKTAEGDPAKLEFYTSDVASTFEIRIEGITEDGRPFVRKEEFSVN